MQVSVSSPYRENTIVHIAKTATRQGHLNCFYTSLYLASWQARAERLPIIGHWLADELAKRAFPGIEGDRVVKLAILPELAYIGMRRFMGQHQPVLTAGLMYWVKKKFDASVARHLERTPTDVLVGMYAASLKSFEAIHRCGGLAVLNFVNSHPVVQNRYLIELAGVKTPHHELILDGVAQRVDAELALADLVLVPSRFVAEQLISRDVPEEKIALLPYGVDLHTFHPSVQRDPIRAVLDCLYVGQISHRKGIRILLDAARCCRDLPVCFSLIGPIVSREVLDDLPENVHYKGMALPGGGVAEAMREADFFVLPTVEDSFALVVFEAMASGLPVITTSHAGSSELLEDGKDGLIVPAGDANRLTEAIRRLVRRPDLRNQLGKAARKKVRDSHSWEAYGRSVFSAIKCHLGGSQGAKVDTATVGSA